MNCRHNYCWMPIGSRELTDGNLYMVDLGICARCGKATSRVTTAGPGDVVSAMLWGKGFEVKRVNP